MGWVGNSDSGGDEKARLKEKKYGTVRFQHRSTVPDTHISLQVCCMKILDNQQRIHLLSKNGENVKFDVR